MNQKIASNIFRNTRGMMNNSHNLPADFTTLKQLHKDFAEKMNKSDFANSPRRFITELSYIKILKELAKKYNLAEELKEINIQEAEIRKKLSEFGITIAD